MDRAGTLLRPTYNTEPHLINFERSEISLDCNSFEKANYDVSIEGLGWFSVQGKGFLSMFINLSFGIPYHIRNESIRPWDLKDKGGLQKYTGMTVNTKSPKNKKLSRKY